MQAQTPTRTSAARPVVNQRHDGYRAVHKALRLYMTDTLNRVGRCDPTDNTEVDTTLNQLDALLTFLEQHIAHERDFLHPALERARAGSAGRVDHDHAEHAEATADLRDGAAYVRNTSGAVRGAGLLALYRNFALFVAENLVHMHHEETELNAVLWEHYSDDELIAIERALVGSIPPFELMQSLPWFIAAQNAPERAAMLRGMQAGMPPEAFLGVLDAARGVLSAADNRKLLVALDLPN